MLQVIDNYATTITAISRNGDGTYEVALAALPKQGTLAANAAAGGCLHIFSPIIGTEAKGHVKNWASVSGTTLHSCTLVLASGYSAASISAGDTIKSAVSAAHMASLVADITAEAAARSTADQALDTRLAAIEGALAGESAEVPFSLWIPATHSGGKYFTKTELLSGGSISVSMGSALCGCIAVQGGFIYYTADGGATWTPSSDTTARAWSGIDMRSATHGCACVFGGLIYNTSDGGATWTPQSNSTWQYWKKVKMGTTTHGCAYMYTTSSATTGYIYYTSDSGATWTRQTDSTARSWRAIDMYDASYGIASIASFTSPIFYTIDGGITWTQCDSITLAFDVCALKMRSQTAAVAFTTGGYAYKSSDGGKSWSEAAQAFHTSNFVDFDMYGDIGIALNISGASVNISVDGANSFAIVSGNSGPLIGPRAVSVTSETTAVIAAFSGVYYSRPVKVA